MNSQVSSLSMLTCSFFQIISCSFKEGSPECLADLVNTISWHHWLDIHGSHIQPPQPIYSKLWNPLHVWQKLQYCFQCLAWSILTCTWLCLFVFYSVFNHFSLNCFSSLVPKCLLFILYLLVFYVSAKCWSRFGTANSRSMWSWMWSMAGLISCSSMKKVCF